MIYEYFKDWLLVYLPLMLLAVAALLVITLVVAALRVLKHEKKQEPSYVV